MKGQVLIIYTSSMPGKHKWKNVKSRTNAKKQTRLALMVLGLIISFVILAQIVRFGQMFFSPWGLTSDKKYLWDGKFNINLIIHSNITSLLSYSPKDKKITIIDLPDQTYLELPFGFGNWQLQSIFDLGNSQIIGGHKLLEQTFVKFFAVPIDGVLEVDPRFGNFFETIKNPISSVNLLSNLKSDLTVWELLRLQFNLYFVRFDKIQKIDLIKMNVLTPDQLPDGTKIFKADLVRLDSLLSVLQDPVILSERKSVAVFNATNYPRLANSWSRLITNLGANVIITTNATKNLTKTQITGEKSATLIRLKQIFDQNDKLAGENISSRADINLLLGEDWVK